MKLEKFGTITRETDGSLGLHGFIVNGEGRDMRDTADVAILKLSIDYLQGELLRRLVAQETEKCARTCEEIDDSCDDCAAHNDHDQCRVPAREDYARAVRERLPHNAGNQRR